MSSSLSSRGRDGGRRGGHIERPSSSRQRSSNGVWPEPFVEALAFRVATDAAHTIGRLAAGPAITSVFQVCSTWRAISQSELLWQNLTRRIWGRDHLLHDTWHNEYIHRHRTAYNFRIGRSVYETLDFDASDSEDNDGLSCRCLALSDFYLACGFFDGTVRLFDLSTRVHVNTFRPYHRDRLGRFSRAVTGIVLSDSNLVFASLDGDIHVAIIQGMGTSIRRAHMGNVLNDGTLVNFAGCRRWWVGLFAGVPGRSFHVWDGDSEELVFVGGSLTDPEAVMGWHLLTDMTASVGRVRVTSEESAVACTGLRVIVFDLRNHGVVLGEEGFERDVIVVDSVDVSNEGFLMVVDTHGIASVRRVGNLEEIYGFAVRGGTQRGILGCINNGYAVLCIGGGGAVRVWEAGQHGEFLYSLRERISGATALIADERYVAAYSSDAGIHLWDFGAL